MLKKISIKSSRREMAQRDSVELCGDTGCQAPTCIPPCPVQASPAAAHSPLGTHIDTGGIEGALVEDQGKGDVGKGDVGKGEGGQQHMALAAQHQPDGDGQPQQAGQAAPAAAAAQGKTHPFLQEGREEAAWRAGPRASACPGSLLQDMVAVHTQGWLQPGGCWARGWGAGGAYEGSMSKVVGQHEGAVPQEMVCKEARSGQ